MNRIKKTLNNQGGFTLIEMLIVVAIIAILIAISIPMVNSSLEKARKSTDQANLRAAKAAALLDYASDSPTVFNYPTGTTSVEGCYNAKDGKIQDSTTTSSEKLGRSSALTGDEVDGGSDVPKDKHIHITLDTNGKVIKLYWKGNH